MLETNDPLKRALNVMERSEYAFLEISDLHGRRYWVEKWTVALCG
jgi:hypothetical protein